MAEYVSEVEQPLEILTKAATNKQSSYMPSTYLLRSISVSSEKCKPPEYIALFPDISEEAKIKYTELSKPIWSMFANIYD